MFPSSTTSPPPSSRLTMLSTPFLVRFSCHFISCHHAVARLMIHQGFSFSGEVREPFPAVIRAMEETSVPVTSVDAPSSWNIEDGPPKSGVGGSFNPNVLVSLTAPKPLVRFFKGRHFIGGRFVLYLTSCPSHCMGLFRCY